MGNLPFDFRRQSKEGFRQGELIFNLLNSDTMVDKSKEASGFGSFNKLLGDLLLSGLEVWPRLLCDF